MTLARRIAEHFVLPAARDADADQHFGRLPAHDADADEHSGPLAARDADAAAVSARPSPALAAPTVALLAPRPDAPALGAALGLALARARGAPAAVVCLWSASPAIAPPRAPALPAARRLAAALARRGHDARAAGRLACVRLAADGAAAAAEAQRAGAAAGAAPVVLALGGPRSAAFDALLELQDLVVVAVARDADPALAGLALGGLAHAVACVVPPADPARSLAAAGLALLPSTRRALAAPVAALP